MTALQQSLSDEITSREQMLSAREREVIENHLIGEVATELQTLIRGGEDWVKIANTELDQRPASSGIKLHFVWEVNPEASEDLETARRLLLKMTAAWSPMERESLGRFLHGRIQAERAADESAPWQEHPSRALDYRAWHRFTIQRFQDGQRKGNPADNDLIRGRRLPRSTPARRQLLRRARPPIIVAQPHTLRDSSCWMRFSSASTRQRARGSWGYCTISISTSS